MSVAKECAGRKHKWNASGVCSKCNAPKRGPGRPPGPSGKKVAGETVAGRLAATLGVAASPASIVGPPTTDGAVANAPPPTGAATAPPDLTTVGSTPADVAALAVEKAPRPKVIPKWTKPAGKRGARAFVAFCDWAIEVCGREAEEADDEDVDDFGEALGEQLGVWFPNAELTPAKQMLLSGACIVGGMCIGSKKIEKPPTKPALALVKDAATPVNGVGAAPAAPGAASTSPATPPQA
jgi:hypothetical protein